MSAPQRLPTGARSPPSSTTCSGFCSTPWESSPSPRHLAIDYLAPVLLDTPYTLRSHIHSRAGRKLHLRATIENNHAHVVTTATALFLIVDIDHFLTPRHNASAATAPTTHEDQQGPQMDSP